LQFAATRAPKGSTPGTIGRVKLSTPQCLHFAMACVDEVGRVILRGILWEVEVLTSEILCSCRRRVVRIKYYAVSVSRVILREGLHEVERQIF
jgi:hypothetical protein